MIATKNSVSPNTLFRFRAVIAMCLLAAIFCAVAISFTFGAVMFFSLGAAAAIRLEFLRTGSLGMMLGDAVIFAIGLLIVSITF